MYAADHNAYPTRCPAWHRPEWHGNLSWLKAGLAVPTPIGGLWDWDCNTLGIRAGVSVVSPQATLAEMQEIDRMIDDGDLSRGVFVDLGSSRYTSILE